MKMRIKEIEEECKIKTEKVEYDLKYEAQCQTERQRSDLIKEKIDIEERCKNKIEELEGKLRMQISESRKNVNQLENELNKISNCDTFHST